MPIMSDLPHVAHFELGRDATLDGLHASKALARHNQVVDVHKDEDAPVHRVVPFVKARVHRRPRSSHLPERFVEPDAPQPPRLLRPIQGQAEPAHIRKIPRLDTLRELDLHLFVHLSVEEGCLYVNVVDLPPVGCCHGSQCP